MIRTKLFLGGALAFVMSLPAATTTLAQEPVDQTTFFTFSAPFELPGGQTLPAGRYLFRILDSPSNRHIVQVLSEDRQQIHATVMAIPAERRDPAPEPEVRFMETAADAPPAIRTWWYPGRVIGHEFIYPREHAQRLAARQQEGVLTTRGAGTTPDEMRDDELTRLGAQGERPAEEQARTQPQPGQTQPGQAQPGQTAQQQPTQPAQPAGQTADRPRAEAQQPAPTDDTMQTRTDQRAQQTRTRLPRTASMLPLVGFIGVASLIGAAGIRRLRRR
jgi:hypothetical protein